MKKTKSKSNGKSCCGMKKCGENSSKKHEKMESPAMKKMERKRGIKS
jgi:hypothetical protein